MSQPDSVLLHKDSDADSATNLAQASIQRGQSKLFAFGHFQVAWFVYRDKRKLTSHTYNATKAAEVFTVIPQCANDAKRLLAQLQARGHEDA